MRRYIVISPNGFTEDDECQEVQNAQVIGIYSVESADMAAHFARLDLQESGQYFENLTVYRLHPNDNVLITHGTFKDES